MKKYILLSMMMLFVFFTSFGASGSLPEGKRVHPMMNMLPAVPCVIVLMFVVYKRYITYEHSELKEVQKRLGLESFRTGDILILMTVMIGTVFVSILSLVLPAFIGLSAILFIVLLVTKKSNRQEMYEYVYRIIQMMAIAAISIADLQFWSWASMLLALGLTERFMMEIAKDIKKKRLIQEPQEPHQSEGRAHQNRPFYKATLRISKGPFFDEKKLYGSQLVVLTFFIIRL